MRRLLAILGVLAVGASVVVPAGAHHSVSGLFDARDARLYTVKGVLKDLDWMNPHIYLTVEARDTDGKLTTYRFENFPPSFWRRQGVNKSAFKVGEPITIEAYPARDGTRTLGWAKIIHFADGRTIATMTAENADSVR
jgi:hypothetical protein